MRILRPMVGYVLAFSLVLAVPQLRCGGDSAQTPPAQDMAVMPSDLSAPDGAVGGPMLSLVAGGLGGNGSVDDTGAAARFDRPLGMALDAAGNLYVADYNNNTIRKVVISSGVVSTLAGTAGMSGSTDGTGAAARFNGPTKLALDGAGNLYVADQGNIAIRKVVISSGVVSTVASLGAFPTGLAVDRAGSLYVAEESNIIGKVDLSNGMVSTVAGTAGMFGYVDGTGAAARFNVPSGLAVDAAGDLYVTEQVNYTLRKVVPSSGVVTTLAGSAGMSGTTDGSGTAARFSVPNDVQVDPAGNVYVIDDAVIRKVVPSSGVVTTLAGSYSLPAGLAADNAGTLYVSNSNRNIISKTVLPGGVMTDLAGAASMPGSADGTGAAARFNGPCGVAFDGAGNLYVVDPMNQAIRKVVLASGVVTTTLTNSLFGRLDAVALDGTGNLYFTDQTNHVIYQVVLASGVVTTLAGTAGQQGSTDGIGAAARFYDVNGLAVDGAGNLYVADSGNSTIRKVVLASGVVTTLAGSAGMSGYTDGIGAAARFNVPIGVALDGAGNLYVADRENQAIRKIVLANASVTTLVGRAGQSGVKLGPLPGGLTSPSAVAALPTGELIIVDDNENAVLAVH